MVYMLAELVSETLYLASHSNELLYKCQLGTQRM